MYSSSAFSPVLMIIIMILILAGLGCIPAHIAKNKGYRFGIWWLYGTFLFVISLIHIALLPNKNTK